MNAGKRMAAFRQNGHRYDTGDKLGYIEATIEFALKRQDLAPHLKTYLSSLVKQWEKE
ncbi:UTP--glucose-1-phosphate uridylyltransferase [compost metagenome]